MSRTVAREVKPAPRPVAPPKAEKPKETTREMVEQIVVAFILAILIRGYDAEAFVIPTGSMAPTLMGRHKQVTCPQCGYEYAVNAADDIERLVAHSRLAESGICVNCRYRTEVGDLPSFKGDRILVMKFPFELPWLPGASGPKRWDVIVFHYPENPEQNYIKRLVGLPGEELRILHGDIQARPAVGAAPFATQRKPLFHQDAMQILVHDDAHRPKLLAGKPEWARWRGEGWQEGAGGSYAVEAAPGASWSRLGYRHLVPDPEQWQAIERGTAPPRAPRPTLITDFYAYNTNLGQSAWDRWMQAHEGYLQSNWVGDLTLDARVDPAGITTKDQSKSPDSGSIRFELVEAGIANRCEVDLATGRATLYHGDRKLGEADTALRAGTGAHDVSFANVDDRLTFRIDGTTPFGDGIDYEDSPETPYAPTAADLDPASISIRGAGATASGLVLKRDIYYTQDPGTPDHKIAGVYDSFDRDDGSEWGRVLHVFDYLGDPARFSSVDLTTPHRAYPIRPDHYMMMGDNSPRSADSRAWSSGDNLWGVEDRSSWEVPRQMLVGKAFFIYWPHGKPFGPDIRLTRDLRIPFRPYFERMRWIR